MDRINPDLNSTNQAWRELAEQFATGTSVLEQARLDKVTAPDDAHSNPKTVQRVTDEKTVEALKKAWQKKLKEKMSQEKKS